MPALEHLAAALRRRADDWADVVTAGRTHLMDAVPITLGQEAGGWASAGRVRRRRGCATRCPGWRSCPSAAPRSAPGSTRRTGSAPRSSSELRAATGLDVLTEAPDHIEAQAARDGLVEASGALRTVAVSLYKIANDIRWLGSGPRTGLAELQLPDLQPGSSIMPGKVNPVICEATMMVAAQVIGNDACVAFSGSQGNLQLNVMMPVMARNVLESARLLAAAARLLADKVVDGAEADVERTPRVRRVLPVDRHAAEQYLGYEEAAAVAKQALKERRTIREVVIERGHVRDGHLTEEQLDAALDVLAMARGGHRAGTVDGPRRTAMRRGRPDRPRGNPLLPPDPARLRWCAGASDDDGADEDRERHGRPGEGEHDADRCAGERRGEPGGAGQEAHARGGGGDVDRDEQRRRQHDELRGAHPTHRDRHQQHDPDDRDDGRQAAAADAGRRARQPAPQHRRGRRWSRPG